MNPEEQRAYEELTLATGATPIEPTDVGAERCLRFLLDGEGTLDDFIEGCYGEPTDNAEEREFSEAEETAYRQLSSMMGTAPIESAARGYAEDDGDEGVTSAQLAELLGVAFHDAERGVWVVPRDLYESINNTYAEVSRWGFATERHFEEALYEWISRG